MIAGNCFTDLPSFKKFVPLFPETTRLPQTPTGLVVNVRVPPTARPGQWLCFDVPAGY